MKHLRRIFPYVRPYASKIAIGLFLTALGVGVMLLVPALLKEALDGLSRGQSGAWLVRIALTLVALALLRGGLQFVGRYWVVAIARRIEYDLRSDLFRKLVQLGSRFYAKVKTGDLTSRVINDLDAVRMLVGFGLVALFGTLLMTVGAVVAMFIMSAHLAALSLLPLLGVSAVVAFTFWSQQKRSLEVQERLGAIGAAAQESFAGVRIVRAFGHETSAAAKMTQLCDDYLSCNIGLARVRGASWALMAVLAESALVVTLWIGGRDIIQGRFTSGGLVAFAAYQFMLVWPMIALGWISSQVVRANACMQRLCEILDASPEVSDGGHLPAHGRSENSLHVRGLDFRYGPEFPLVIQGVSLVIEPGTRAALVGSTGAGKTTLLKLLARLLPTPRGTVFLGEEDVSEIPLDALRLRISMVPQEDFLFSDTIYSNLAMGCRDGPDEGIVRRASDVSEFKSDVEAFPNRWEQVVGERGLVLSGGQRQRACLARALAREADLLLLDDCFSSVDSNTEREIYGKLWEHLRGRTCLLATHRLSAAREADVIYVLDHGRMAEVGNHDTLVSQRGIYARLYELQQLAVELEKE